MINTRGTKYSAKDIAKRLKVSPATVSLVLNNKPGVGEKTRKKILDTIHELGAEEQLLKASTLLHGNIGFVIYKRNGKIVITSPFYPLMLEKIEQTARRQGYQLTIIHLEKNAPIEEQIDYVNNCNCKGLAVFATEMLEDDMQIFEQLRLPTVLIDNRLLSYEADSVIVDNERATYQMVEHLYQLGHRRIGYLQSKEFINSFGERKRCFLAARSHFLPDQIQEDVYLLNYSEEEAYCDFKNILAQNDSLPTAFCADNDLLAFGAIRALKDAGIAVPDEVSVFGFDDRPICLMSDPPIASMRILSDGFADMVMWLLARRMSEKDGGSKPVAVNVRVNAELIERGSISKI